jgi:hypothetical protein
MRVLAFYGIVLAILIRKSNGLMTTRTHLAAISADREVVSGSTVIAQANLRDKAFRDMDFSASLPATIEHDVAADDIWGGGERPLARSSACELAPFGLCPGSP